MLSDEEIEAMAVADLRLQLTQAGHPTTGTKPILVARLQTIVRFQEGERKRKRDEEENVSCPVCMEVMLPPVQQCQRGHAICSKCLDALPAPKLCPECRQSLASPSRNLRLEAAAANVEVSCVHARTGCTQRLCYKDVVDHAKSCGFRPFHCPLRDWSGGNCTWTGGMADMSAHIEGTHTGGEAFNLTQNGAGAWTWAQAIIWARRTEARLSATTLRLDRLLLAGDNSFFPMLSVPPDAEGPCKAIVLHLSRDEDAAKKWCAQVTLHNRKGREEVSFTFPVLSCRKSWLEATHPPHVYFEVPRRVLHRLNEADDADERVEIGFKLKIFSV